MQRRDFLKSTVAVAVAAELGMGKAQAKVPAHNWGSYDFGSGPTVNDRLNQGPFPQYPPDAVIPTDDVVMTTTSTEEVVPNFGKGLVTYITADSGPDEIKAMTAAYEAALIDLGIADRNDPLTELIARSIVNVTATGERDPVLIKQRAINALGVRKIHAA